MKDSYKPEEDLYEEEVNSIHSKYPGVNIEERTEYKNNLQKQLVQYILKTVYKDADKILSKVEVTSLAAKEKVAPEQILTKEEQEWHKTLLDIEKALSNLDPNEIIGWAKNQNPSININLWEIKECKLKALRGFHYTMEKASKKADNKKVQ